MGFGVPAVEAGIVMPVMDFALAAVCRAVRLAVILSTVSLMDRLSVAVWAGDLSVKASDTDRPDTFST